MDNTLNRRRGHTNPAFVGSGRRPTQTPVLKVAPCAKKFEYASLLSFANGRMQYSWKLQRRVMDWGTYRLMMR